MKLAVALVTVYLVWGSTYLAIAVADRTLPPFLMLSARFLIAGALLYWWSARQGELAAERPGRRQWRAAAIVGGLLLVVDTGGVAWAELRVSSGIAALLVIVFGSLVAFTAYGWLLKNAPTRLLSTYAYVNPAVAVFLGWAFIGEHVGGREIAAGLVILSSIGLLVFARAPREPSEPTPESLPFHIREQEARGAEFQTVPRLHELVRVTA